MLSRLDLAVEKSSKRQDGKGWGFPPQTPPLLGVLVFCLGAQAPPNPPKGVFEGGGGAR